MWSSINVSLLLDIFFVSRQQKEVVATSTRSIISSIGEPDTAVISRSGSPTAAEKDILRYYYYIYNGIDTEHVAPMEDSWLDNVLSSVPDMLKVRLQEYIDLDNNLNYPILLSAFNAIKI